MSAQHDQKLKEHRWCCMLRCVPGWQNRGNMGIRGCPAQQMQGPDRSSDGNSKVQAAALQEVQFSGQFSGDHKFCDCILNAGTQCEHCKVSQVLTQA